MRSHLLLVAASLLMGCPPEDKAKKETPPATRAQEACTRFGQSCEFSPGKLGTCVTKDGCTEPSPACFVCQSQH